MKWCWNGAAIDEKGAATRKIHGHGAATDELSWNRVATGSWKPVEACQVKKYRESTRGCRDYL